MNKLDQMEHALYLMRWAIRMMGIAIILQIVALILMFFVDYSRGTTFFLISLIPFSASFYYRIKADKVWPE